MTLHLHRSNDLELMVEVLAKLPAPAGSDPFEPETIVLQTRGMERWLSMRLAQRRGVFAHGRFLSIDDLLDELMDALIPVENSAHWRPGQLVWRIAEVLRGASTDDELTALATWLLSTRRTTREPTDALPDQIVQLAWRIAEVFVRYALHRPDVVDAWEEGSDEVRPGQEWQPALWRRLASDIVAPHPGRRLRALVAHLSSVEGAPAGLPRRLVLFGHHTLVPLHIEVLAALGRHCEVHLFYPAIGPGMGGDANVVRHPLQSSLGRLLAQLDELLVGLAPGADWQRHLKPPERKTLLERLQHALYHGAIVEDLTTTSPEAIPLKEDRSISFHACASPLRQVEVLRDELLELFVEDETLEPRHVIVMTPNMETYAPLIDAVFRDGDRDIPEEHPLSAGFPPIHRLHDLSLRRTNPIAESFLAILSLAGGRYTLPEVLDVLALPPVLATAGLLEEELTRLQELVGHAHIRWARDEEHRVREGQPPTRRNTWAGGFDRLLLGHALASNGVDDYLGVVPVDDVEGKDETRTLGLFIDYVEHLFDELADLHLPKSVPAWRTRLVQLINTLLVHDDTSAGLAQVVFDVLRDIVDRAERGGFTGDLELDAMRGLLDDPLEARRPSVSFLSGGLTFCTLLPMRTIPFRVVCLLGMDEGEFPRSPHGLGFDLLEGQTEPGDRSGRDDDRMTFLETLTAARQHLLVTWTGYRATDKRELDAAGPVAELMESLRRGLDVPKLPAPILVRHPLQPFTPRNFREPPMSFDRRYLRGASAILGERGPPPPHWVGAIDAELPRHFALGSLVASFEAPSRWFCRERLRVSLSERDHELLDREPLDMDPLARWGLRDQVLAWELDDVPAEQRLVALEASGVLPLGAAGRLVLSQVEDEVRSIARRVRSLRADSRARRSPPITVTLSLGEIQLGGQLDLRFGDQRIIHQAGKVRPKAIIALWIRHLALAAALRRPVWSHLVGQDRHAELQPVSPARARELLRELVGLHLQAHRRPLPMFPNTSCAWFGYRAPGTIPNRIPKPARDAWHRWFGARDIGDAADVHTVLLFAPFDDDYPFGDPTFRQLAERVWGPLGARPDGVWTNAPEERVLRWEGL